MSSDSTSDGIDDPPAIIDEDAVSTGAAADSSDLDDRLKALPRLLRYAMLADETDAHVAQRLAAEIDELCPGLAFNAAWLASREGVFGSDLGTGPGLTLATELDRRCRRGHPRPAQPRRLRPAAVAAHATRHHPFCRPPAGGQEPAARFP